MNRYLQKSAGEETQRKCKVVHLSTNEIRSRLFLQRSFNVCLVPLSGRKRFTLQRKIRIYLTAILLVARGVIAATIAEFSHAPTGTTHLIRRLLFLLITLGPATSLTVYIAVAESRTWNQTGPLIPRVAQFLISVAATLIFAVVPPGRMFGDRVRSPPHSRRLHPRRCRQALHEYICPWLRHGVGALRALYPLAQTLCVGSHELRVFARSIPTLCRFTLLVLLCRFATLGP